MSNVRIFVGTVAVLLLTLSQIAGAFPAGLGQAARAVIHVRLVDLAGLPESLRVEAEATARAIFRTSGVELDFVECLSGAVLPCKEAPGKADFWLQILRERPRRLHGDATGYAMLTPSERNSDSYAVVWLPQVESAAGSLEVPVAEVLGASVAHEIGHLLLHSSSHSRSGIMRARLDQEQIRLLERGELRFTQSEAARLVERTGLWRHD